MAIFKEVTVTITAAEAMALIPVLDREIAYQKTYAGASTVAAELQSIKEKIGGDPIEDLVEPDSEKPDNWLLQKLRKGKK